jgi:hypothetical protein
MKNLSKGFKSRFGQAEERKDKLKDRTMDIIESELQKEKDLQ